MKICTKCKVEKPFSEFHRWASTPDGYHYNCKDCKRAYRRANDQLPHNLARTKAYHFKRTYGISLEDYDVMLLEQGGVCAICGKEETHRGRSGNITPLAVDHNHVTGEVRGLLCHACNTTLGNVNDSVEILENAIAYLRKWEVNNDQHSNLCS